MKLNTFESYEKYVALQKRTSIRRSGNCFFTDVEIANIANWLKSRSINPSVLICHGARNGQEADELLSHFPESEMVATDLFPYQCKGLERSKVLVQKHDFSEPREEWIGHFDVIYSNSLDHARDPIQALHTWLDQLNDNGHLFLRWDAAAVEATGGDCFGAHLDEYIKLADSVGTAVDIYLNRTKWDRSHPMRCRSLNTVTLVIGKKL